MRRDLWGYATDRNPLDNDDLIAEKYRGIRPAPGYPACPDHLVKRDMFDVLQASEIGMSVTESLAMLPAASVSGFYLAHPDSTYFSVGKIGEDQLERLRKTDGVVENRRRTGARAFAVSLAGRETYYIGHARLNICGSAIFGFVD